MGEGVEQGTRGVRIKMGNECRIGDLDTYTAHITLYSVSLTHSSNLYLFGLGLADCIWNWLFLLLNSTFGEQLHKFFKVHSWLLNFLPHEWVTWSKDRRKEVLFTLGKWARFNLPCIVWKSGAPFYSVIHVIISPQQAFLTFLESLLMFYERSFVIFSRVKIHKLYTCQICQPTNYI